ncbi:hypothetical protein ACHAL6_07450 [Proteiniclasticum sp. C24MP]|uniref:hypothetical protein n=1 Tax=Proteiniclasticum sp. C24MP TaxID=3374101 RepID=UPI003753F965
MPKINRIRIINFSYNGDKRLILDEQFNFHQGENALMSLKNGGGKSVLVQAIMQPILPAQTLQKRKISDFFVKKKLPSYILIEWKLDGDGGYLTTGICMENKERHLQDQEEQGNSVRYFTFTTSYRRPDTFDILRIPLVEKSDNRVIIRTFKESYDLLQAERKERPNVVSIFPEHEKKAYQAHLLSFNINSDEWKTIMVPINSEEGGIIKIFEKCKTSRQLMRDWILKTVDKVLFDDTRESQSLHEMMGNLAQTMIDNEEYMVERDLLKGFSDNLRRISDEVRKVASTYGDQMEVEGKLLSLDRYLEEEILRISESIEEDLVKLDLKEREKVRIAQEKISHDYYEAENRHEKSRIRAEELKKVFEELSAEKERLYHRMAVMDAAEIHEELLELETKLAGVETDLRRVEDQSEDQMMIERLSYSIKLAYKVELEDLRQKLDKKRHQAESLKEEQQKLKEEMKQKEEKRSTLKERVFSLKIRIEQYQQKEENLSARIRMVFQRNLMGGLDLKEAGRMEKHLEKLMTEAIGEIDRLDAEITKRNEEEEAIQKSIPEITEEKGITRLHHKKKEDEIEIFLKKEEVFIRCLEKYNLNQVKRFDQEYVAMEFQKLLLSAQEKLDGHKEEIRSLRKRESAMKNNILHVSKEYWDYLMNSGIIFETGESYLQRQTAEIREKLMQSAPLLPYAFLMTEEELLKAKSQRPLRPLLQPIPVMLYQSLESEEENGEASIDLGKGMSIFCYPDRKLFESDGIESYKKDLVMRLESEEASKAHYEELLKSIRADESMAENFEYTENWLKEARLEEEALSEKLRMLIEREEELQIRVKRLKIERRDLMEKRRSEEKSREHLERNLEDFRLHLSENEECERDFREKTSREDELKELERYMEVLSRQLEKVESDVISERNEVYKMELVEEAKASEARVYDSFEERPLVEGTLSSLLVQLKKYKDSLDGNVLRLTSEKEELHKRLDKARGKLRDTGIVEEEYKARSFSLSEKAVMKENLKNLEPKFTSSVEQLREADNEAFRRSGMLEGKLNELQKMMPEPLDKEEIRGHYVERTAACETAIRSIRVKVKDSNGRIDEYRRLRDRIKLIMPDRNRAEAVKKWIPEKNASESFEELGRRLSQLKKLMSEQRSEVQSSYQNLNYQYQGKNYNLSSILEAFQKMHQQAEKDYEKYYYLYEHTENHLESLNHLIHVNELQLETMEENFKDTVTMSYNLAREIYDHVNRVADDSSIMLDGRSRKVKMIEIILKELEPQEKGFEAMRQYITERADEVKQQLKSGKTKKDLREMIARFMSSEELLNVVSDLSDLRIKAFKIDVNAKHSQAKDWEKVMRENSGGERFVSFFAVMVALMSYSRNSQKLIQEYHKIKDTKVLLMDNPFGPISSEHLLKPLFEIANKYDTQLICLTDLKQNSIMNQFKVIFMLKIMGNTTGTMEYLTVEEEPSSDYQDEVNENLEMVNYHFKEMEQISLLDGIAE